MAGTFGVTVAVMMLFFWLSVLSLLLSAREPLSSAPVTDHF
jgi:hypothetical protein